MRKQKPIYTLDLETDPFKHGRLPMPFCAGFYDGNTFSSWWRKRGTNMPILKACVDYMNTREPGYVFIHNGGRFDLFYLMDYMSNDELFILNNRIVRCYIGKQEIRDSFSIMPFALARYKKDEIDYNKMEAEVRDNHREEITSYLKGDCVYLHELCSRFVDRFGPKLTIGSTALHELKKVHKYKRLSTVEDKEIRSKFYYGGRVQCFEKGIISTDVKVYDVNSMYPYVMRNFLHPVGRPKFGGKKVTSKTQFITVEGKSNGAFPYRIKHQGICYPCGVGIFHVSIHEYKCAVDLNLFHPFRIIETVDFENTISFAQFVDMYYGEREKAKRNGDAITALFTKFVLNSAYGKFAQNPENAFEYAIKPFDVLLGENWLPSFIAELKYTIWKRPSPDADELRQNVATAASITGAARSVLMEAIAKAKRPIYCDTDSIICESLENVPIHKTELGAWKKETEGSKVAIAGRKLYAVWDGNDCVKIACKGVRITPNEMERVAKGEQVIYERDVPSFKWDGSHNFITRKVQLT